MNPTLLRICRYLAEYGPQSVPGLAEGLGLGPAALVAELRPADLTYVRQVAGARCLEWDLLPAGEKAVREAGPSTNPSEVSHAPKPRPAHPRAARTVRASSADARPAPGDSSPARGRELAKAPGEAVRAGDGQADAPPPQAPEVLTAAGVTAQVEQISPIVAKAYLGCSRGNRLLRKRHVTTLSALMRAGDWVVGQPLLFSGTGRLLDGHHRLRAVVASKVSVPFLVVRGIADAAWEHLDTGVVRRVHDRLAVMSEGHGALNRRAVDVAQVRHGLDGHQHRPSVAEIRAIWATLGPAIQSVVNLVGKPLRGVSRPSVLLAIAEYFHRAPDPATAFCQDLHRDQPGNRVCHAHQLWLLAEASALFLSQGPKGATRSIYGRTVQACLCHLHQYPPVSLTSMRAAWPDPTPAATATT